MFDNPNCSYSSRLCDLACIIEMFCFDLSILVSSHCRIGAIRRRRQEEANSRAGSSGDSSDEGTQLMAVSALPAFCYHCVPEEFSNVCLSRTFGQARDSPSSYFHTGSQFWLFRGGIDTRPMHEQQWVSWVYLESFMCMAGLVDMFRAMGWRNVLGFKQDWNDVVIRQFYATLKITAQKEKSLVDLHQ